MLHFFMSILFAQFRADYQHVTTNRQNIFKTFRRKICLFKIFALSLHSQINGAIAQLVEQRTENPCVPGSIPGGTTRKIANNLNYRLLAILNLNPFS